MTNVYETGKFPTQEEIVNNDLYQQFTSYCQIDPCCGGPIVYDIVEKATIEKIAEVEEWGEETKLRVNVNGEIFDCEEIESITVVSIGKDGEIKKLTYEDIRDGQCLVSRNSYYSNGETYSIDRIFYIEK